MRTFAAIALLGFLCACSSGKSTNEQSSTAPAASEAMGSESGTKVVLRGSQTTFKAADAACAGALGSVMFTLGHVRTHAASGVQERQRESEPGITTFNFSDKASGKSATVLANGHDHSVSGKNLTTKLNGAVACVGAE